MKDEIPKFRAMKIKLSFCGEITKKSMIYLAIPALASFFFNGFIVASHPIINLKVLAIIKGFASWFLGLPDFSLPEYSEFRRAYLSDLLYI